MPNVRIFKPIVTLKLCYLGLKCTFESFLRKVNFFKHVKHCKLTCRRDSYYMQNCWCERCETHKEVEWSGDDTFWHTMQNIYTNLGILERFVLWIRAVKRLSELQPERKKTKWLIAIIVSDDKQFKLLVCLRLNLTEIVVLYKEPQHFLYKIKSSAQLPIVFSSKLPSSYLYPLVPLHLLRNRILLEFDHTPSHLQVLLETF